MGTISKSYYVVLPSGPWTVVRRPSGFKLLRFRNFLTAQHSFSSYIFTITWTTILWSKQVAEHVAGRPGGEYHEAS